MGNITLKQTDTGIYYIHEYIPSRQFRFHSDSEVAISKKIWDYKDGDADALNLFTNELMEAITIMTRGMSGDKIGLVAVPPSKVDKNSAVRDSIWNIEQWYKKGITRINFGCTKTIYDYSNLIQRTEDIRSSHECRGNRTTYEEQMGSMRCIRDGLSKYWTTFIIIDDVTTLGTSMAACTDLLINHGAKEQYIYRLAIARTI